MNQTQNSEFLPDYASPPGETLLDLLNERGMSQVELADRSGRPRKTINEIIHGKAELTSETALQLERVLGIPAHFWNNRERRYRDTLARLEERARLGNQLSWLEHLPITAMTKAGWLPPIKGAVERLSAALSFFGVASPDSLEGMLRSVACDFRQSKKYHVDPYAVLAWIRKGELEAREVRCGTFDQQRFREALDRIRQLTRESVSVSEPETRRLCSRCGVALVFVPELPGTRAWGIARWLGQQKALIQLSLRYKTDDHLWFTFFHEAGHILLHGKRQMFIETRGKRDELGAQADVFAADFLIPARHMDRLRRNPPSTEDEVRAAASKIGVAPGIVVGRLQHEKLLPHSHLNGLKRRLEFVSPEEN